MAILTRSSSENNRDVGTYSASNNEVKSLAFLGLGSTTSSMRSVTFEWAECLRGAKIFWSTLASFVPKVDQKVELQVSTLDDDDTLHLKNIPRASRKVSECCRKLHFKEFGLEDRR